MANHDSTKITRRVAITAALASAAVPMVAGVPALAIGSGEDAAAVRASFVAGCLARTEAVIHDLRTRYVCEGWHGHGLDEKAAERTLDYFRRGMPDDDPDFEAVIRFFGDHGQSLDWIFSGAPCGMVCTGALYSRRAATTDPILAAIEAHRRAHQAFVAVIDGTDDDDPARNVASAAADNVAIELLNVTPTTVAGVIALLQYGYDFEAAGHWWPGDLETGDEPEPQIDSSHKWHVLMFKHAANALDKIVAA